METERAEVSWSWEAMDNLGFNGTNSTLHGLKMLKNMEDNSETTFGMSIGISLIVHIILSMKVIERKIQKNPKSLQVQLVENKQKILTVACYIFSLLISPLLAMILLAFALYRTIVHLILSQKFGESFAGILEGTDAVWAIEDASKSVLNVLAVVECKQNVDLLENMREKMKELVKRKSCRKLSCRIHKMFGYYFWKEQTIDIEKYVRKMEKKDLQDFLEEISNEDLPENHTATWEILLGNDTNNKQNFNVVFRIHHAVGDGLALLTVLLEVLADNETNTTSIKKYLKNIGRKLSYNKPIKNVTNVAYLEKKSAKMEEDKIGTFTDIVKSIFLNVYLLIFAPGCLMMQTMARKKDENVLHGQQLEGNKIIAWKLEQDYSMFKAIKKIKRRIHGTTFSDVLLTAISASFCEYFEKKSTDKPKYVTTVVPARIEKPKTPNVTCQNISDSCQLRNRFSVGMLNLPIFPESEKQSNLHERLSEVKRQTNLLRNSTDYQINYWLLSVVSKIVPESILRPMVQSAQSTMVISNIPGPRQITICDGNTLKDLIFWLPNRGLTGVGVSVLSYGERIQLGLIVDKAIIQNKAEAQQILENVSKYIKELDVSTDSTA